MNRTLLLCFATGSALLSACGGASQPAPTSPPAPPAVAKVSPAAVVSASPAVSPVAVISPLPAVSPIASVSPGVAVSPAASVVPRPSPATATPLPPPTVPSPSAAPPATPTPGVEATSVWVGNTDGSGVYMRNSPHDGDRADALPDGTPLTLNGEQVEGDGQTWLPIKLSDGTEGYVPLQYTTQVEPTGPPTPSQGQPK
jgi:hypothetical protein